MKTILPQDIKEIVTQTESSANIVPAYPGDENWDYPPKVKELISLLAKKAAIDYLKDQGQNPRME
jgi:hypothetical protein